MGGGLPPQHPGLPGCLEMRGNFIRSIRSQTNLWSVLVPRLALFSVISVGRLAHAQAAKMARKVSANTWNRKEKNVFVILSGPESARWKTVRVVGASVYLQKQLASKIFIYSDSRSSCHFRMVFPQLNGGPHAILMKRIPHFQRRGGGGTFEREQQQVCGLVGNGTPQNVKWQP